MSDITAESAPADPSGSVSAIVNALRAGDRAAADALWARYFARMTALARKRLWRVPLGGGDEEDVALSAFLSFCRLPGDPARTPAMNRSRLWSLLAAITSRKATRHMAREGRVKRGGGRQHFDTGELAGAVSTEPSPEAVAAAADDLRRLLDNLGEPELQAVALLRMEGYTAGEIAARLGCAPRTIERRLNVIRYLLADGGAKP